MMNLQVKVGIFITVIGLIASYLVITFEDKNFSSASKQYIIYFDDINGLAKGADVSVKGLKAGRVENITFEGNKIKVIISIKDGIPIYKDATAYIKTMGLMGDKFIYIDNGNPSSGELSENNPISKTKVFASTEDTFNDFSKVAKKIELLIDNLNEAVGNGKLAKLIDDIDKLALETKQMVAENRQNLKKSINNIEKITTSLQETLPKLIEKIDKIANNLQEITSDNKEDIREIVKSLKETAQALKEKAPDTLENINTASKEIRQILEENKEDIRKSVKNIKSSSKKLDEILAKLNEGKGTLGKLINEDDMYENLNEGVKAFSQPFKVILDSNLDIFMYGEYHSGNKDQKAGISMALFPHYDRYIYIGLLSNSNGNISQVEEFNTNGTITTRTKRDLNLLIDLQYSRMLWNTKYGDLWVRAGLKENSAGAGADWWFNRNFRINLDIYKFDRKYADNEPDVPEIDLGLFTKLGKTPFYFRIGGSDLASDKFRGIYITGGLMFNDDYLKYMLGLMNTGM